MEQTSQKVDMDHVRLSEDGRHVVILDQSKLPNLAEYLTLETAEDIYEAIFHLRVRGAPAIGICAGYGMYCLAQTIDTDSFATFYQKLREYGEYLNSSRPTAVNLSWAINRMEQTAYKHKKLPVKEIVKLLGEECRKIHQEDIAMCKKISQYGLSLIKDGDGILTHCNAGPLATSRYGTALGPLILGKEQGMNFHVFADETRPLLQGARLTSYELHSSGVDVTLICDNMAATVMKNGWVDAVFVGCDRVARNGDTANKIGTSSVAIAANYYNVPVYICAPTSTIDMNTATGADIHIEERPAEEVTQMWYRERMAPEGVKVYNPAFDVTDHSLIAGIVTEYGIAREPYEESFREIFARKENAEYD